MLKQRILTALVLAPLILLGLFGLKDQYLVALFALILLLGFWEWMNLAEITTAAKKIILMALQAVLLWSTWWLNGNHPDAVIVILISMVLLWLIILFWLVMYEKADVHLKLAVWSRVLLGLLLLPVTLLGMTFLLLNYTNDRILILIMFILIWGADIAAYFSGRAFGRHKLAVKISPGKTWEGVAGALLASIVISLIAYRMLNYSDTVLPKLVILSLLVVGLSIVGDLFESLLKRQVGVKDSSHLLPGHGGVLDRIDSMIAASPVYALGIYLAGL